MGTPVRHCLCCNMGVFPLWGHQEGRVYVAIWMSPHCGDPKMARSMCRIKFSPLWGPLKGKSYVTILISPHGAHMGRAGAQHIEQATNDFFGPYFPCRRSRTVCPCHNQPCTPCLLPPVHHGDPGMAGCVMPNKLLPARLWGPLKGRVYVAILLSPHGCISTMGT